MISRKIRFTNRFKKMKKSNISRSEIHEPVSNTQKRKDLEAWFLRAGISPASQMPVSHIGIYTDFT